MEVVIIEIYSFNTAGMSISYPTTIAVCNGVIP